MQHQNLNRIPQIIMIKLIVADAMEAHWRIGCDHEIEGGAGWAPFCERWGQPTWCDALLTDERYPHEAARSMWLKLEERTNLFGSHLV
jgi:hypothetical protein